jgi:hypothetical protein
MKRFENQNVVVIMLQKLRFWDLHLADSVQELTGRLAMAVSRKPIANTKS